MFLAGASGKSQSLVRRRRTRRENVSHETGFEGLIVYLNKQQFDHQSLDVCQWSEADRAWAAGFIDGDGMISFYRRSDRHTEFFIKVAAMNTCRDPLEKLQLMFGGSILVMTKATANPNWAPSWSWQVTHRAAERVIHAINGHLVAKHQQAQLALAARALVGDRYRKRSTETLQQLDAIEKQFRQLNKKGHRGLYH